MNQRAGVEPRLELLYESPGLPRTALPEALEAAYGSFGLPDELVYANFVSSLDGVVAFEPEVRRPAGSLLSGSHPGDRLLMGLLRAFADVVLIGAGTLRAEPKHVWTADHVFPAAAADFAELRRRLGLAPEPELVVVTVSGEIPLEARALRRGAVVVTTAAAAKRLQSGLPATSSVEHEEDNTAVDLVRLVEGLRSRGLRRVLTEGGPRLAAELVRAGLVDELFLTVSPVLAGRLGADRPGLVEGVRLLPDQHRELELLSLHRAGSHLFLRYRLSR